MPPPVTQPTDTEQGATQDAQVPQRQPSSVPSFLFISFVLWMIMNNHADEFVTKNQWLDALTIMHSNIQDFSAWLNGTASNFTLPPQDLTLMPLVHNFLTFGRQLDPQTGSYFANLTGFWRGDVQFHNLTNETMQTYSSPPFWIQDVHTFMSTANLTNATELAERLGKWEWDSSTKVAISFGDKLLWSSEGPYSNLSKDVALLHGKIDFSNPYTSDEMRLELEGLHFISNGSLFAFAESSEQGIDLRNLPSLVPQYRINESARTIEAELVAREARIKEKVYLGNMEEGTNDEGPISSCSFKFFGQIQPTNVPQDRLQEWEDEVNEPTGITTIRAPEMQLKGVLVSKDCGILYELPDIKGLKSQGLFRKITTYAGLATLVNMMLLYLLLRQAARSQSAAGLSRVSRYPFVVQSLIDAVSFVGHVTLAILAEGRTSVAVLAPAGLACIMFCYEAQFAVYICQIQAPEDVSPTPPQPALAPSPSPAAQTTPTISPTPVLATGNALQADGQIAPTVVRTPATPTPTTTTPARPSLFRFLFDHIRNDPSARMWAIISFFFLVIFRIVIVLSIPLVFIGTLYAAMWLPQIYRAVRRGRTSGLTAEYLIGTTIGRLYYIMYFLACPKNILDVEYRPWVYGVACFMLLQALVIMLQSYFGPRFFLPFKVATADVYNYHPPLPLPDPEAPEQTLGDCSICMEAIEIDPSLRHRQDEKTEAHVLTRHTSNLWAQSVRKSYSLAPCHHLFHTACLERWLAIKNICPQCRRPLPPL